MKRTSIILRGKGKNNFMTAAYLKIGDIRGESMDSRFPGWIPVESYSPGISMGAGPGTVFGPHVRVTELNFTKLIDRSTAELQRAAAMGRQFELVVLCIAALDESTQGSALVLENTLITSYSFSGGGDRPMESLSLNFTNMTFGTMAQYRTRNTLVQTAAKGLQSLRARKP